MESKEIKYDLLKEQIINERNLIDKDTDILEKKLESFIVLYLIFSLGMLLIKVEGNIPIPNLNIKIKQLSVLFPIVSMCFCYLIIIFNAKLARKIIHNHDLYILSKKVIWPEEKNFEEFKEAYFGVFDKERGTRLKIILNIFYLLGLSIAAYINWKFLNEYLLLTNKAPFPFLQKIVFWCHILGICLFIVFFIFRDLSFGIREIKRNFKKIFIGIKIYFWGKD